MKYKVEFKYECVQKYMQLVHIQHPPGVGRRGFMSQVRVWVKRYHDLGYEGLTKKSTNKVWSKEQRFDLVAKVISGSSITAVSLSAHINPGQLFQWVKKYQEQGINGLECRQGRKSKEPKMSPKKIIRLSASEKEELKLLRERNEYLEIENEYLKKLDALVAQKEAKQLKAKKRK